jgi:hypothetical protein
MYTYAIQSDKNYAQKVWVDNNQLPLILRDLFAKVRFQVL